MTTNETNEILGDTKLSAFNVDPVSNMVNIRGTISDDGKTGFRVDMLIFPNVEKAKECMLSLVNNSSMPLELYVASLALIKDGPGDLCVGSRKLKKCENPSVYPYINEYNELRFQLGNAVFMLEKDNDPVSAGLKIEKLMKELAARSKKGATSSQK